jgi:succinate dehydrogenase assembly factor 1
MAVLSQLNPVVRALRMANNKPEAVRPKFRLFVRYTFHFNASKVSPRNVSSIEHLLRKGTKQLEQFEDSAVKDCFLSQAMVEWGLNRPDTRKVLASD